MGHSPIYGDKMTKITLHLEGEAYSDIISIADKFTAITQDRLAQIERLIEQNSELLEHIAEVLADLEKVKEALDDAEE